ncbi:MAG: DUF6452 family protein [Bacteroides sp.]|nr:DUF6452 family protein [Lachnospiraceae bacterium]MCM1331686.1 DUF6452 family protein [Bacteroides sp.]MCM1389895.1 DUF6452 family protein [Bacteroides sp.]
MGNLLKYISVAALSAAILSGCNSSGCINNQNSIPLAGFYSYGTFASISVPGLTVGGVGAPGDSLIQENKSTSSVYLPFRAEQPATSFFFHYNQESLDNDAFNDTLTFSYSSIPYFASEECGAMFRYVINDVTYTKHLIDSVGILDSVITNVDRERIRIYFRTATEDDGEDTENGDSDDNNNDPQQ